MPILTLPLSLTHIHVSKSAAIVHGVQIQFIFVEKHFPVLLVNLLCDNCFCINPACYVGG